MNIRAVGVALALAVLLGACGGADVSGSPATTISSAASTSPSAPAGDAEAQPSAPALPWSTAPYDFDSAFALLTRGLQNPPSEWVSIEALNSADVAYTTSQHLGQRELAATVAYYEVETLVYLAAYERAADPDVRKRLKHLAETSAARGLIASRFRDVFSSLVPQQAAGRTVANRAAGSGGDYLVSWIAEVDDLASGSGYLSWPQDPARLTVEDVAREVQRGSLDGDLPNQIANHLDGPLYWGCTAMLSGAIGTCDGGLVLALGL